MGIVLSPNWYYRFSKQYNNMIKVTSYRIALNGFRLRVEETYELDSKEALEELRNSLKAKYKADHIDFTYNMIHIK